MRRSKLGAILKAFLTPESKQQHAGNVIALPDEPGATVLKKLRRSKKLTRFFFKPHVYSLRSFSEMYGTEGSAGGMPHVNVRQPMAHGRLACKELHRGEVREALPLSREAVIGQAMVRGGSNLIFIAGQAMHHDRVDIRQDRLPEEGGMRALVDVDARLISFPYEPRSPCRISEGAAFCDGAARNYAHWLTEVLPRVFSFYVLHGHRDVPLILDAGLHPNMLRSLALVLDDPPLRYTVPAGQALYVDQLHYVHAVGYIPHEPRGSKASTRSHGVHAPKVLSGMVGRIKSRLVLPEQARKRIYVKRNAGVRQLVNAGEVEAALLKAGFTVIEPEKLSFDEQVTVFHSAEMVIGATGAALANLMFCRPPCKIVILISVHPETPYYFWQSIAQSVGLDVGYLLCETIEAEPTSVHCDFRASIPDLVDLIDQPARVV